MFQSLHIRNFALIENMTIEFGPGLNILSGETGAGKSIIVQALELLLGGRGSVDLIREGDEEAEVVGLFSRGSDVDELTIRRVLTRTGKHKTFINDRPAILSTLEALGQELVDLASQHEHQVLLQPSEHLKLLDSFGGLEALAAYRQVYDQFRKVREELAGLEAKIRQTKQQEDFLRFQLREIVSANLKEGEEEALQSERARSKNGVRLGQIVSQAEDIVYSGEGAVEERLAVVLRELELGVTLDPSLEPTLVQLGEVACQLREASQQLQKYQGTLSCDPERLQEVEDRLALLSQLKRKYGGDIAQALQRRDELEQALGLLDNFDEENKRLIAEVSRLGGELVRKAKVLHKKRGEGAEQLAAQVVKELKQLGMKESHFQVAFQPLTDGLEYERHFYQEGGDSAAEFLLAPNPGEGLHPLARIASGGELSRILLAIKKVMGNRSGKTAPSTYVFDEVDSGVGGGIAEVVGKNLSEMAVRHQVLCVTHLPQVACFGDHHFVIAKRIEKGRTKTCVERLGGKEREEEIARMLAGLQVTEKARAHAREMIKNARP